MNASPVAVNVTTASGPPKLLDLVRQRAAECRLAPAAIESFTDAVRRFILFHDKRHPREMGAAEVATFLIHLVDHEHVSRAARSQTESALRFLYREVLDLPLTQKPRPASAAIDDPHSEIPNPKSEIPRPVSPSAIGNQQSKIENPHPPKLLDRVHQALRLGHYSRRTEDAYVGWIKRYIFFHHVRNPAEMGKPEIEQFLSHLAVQGHVSASTQNQAFSALLFLYRNVLGMKLEHIDALRAKCPRHLPLVLTPDEVRSVLSHLQGLPLLISQLSYGNGMRLMECLHIRVKDIDFQRLEVTVRDGKGEKDRVTLLPQSLVQPLSDQLAKVQAMHARDLEDGLGRAPLPYALAQKYRNADREWGWQYVFPASTHFKDRETGVRHRHHLHESVIQKAFRSAVLQAAISKPATFHTLRHAFATELLANHYDIRTIQELLGHSSVETTMIYTHVLNSGGRGVQSPLDRLRGK